MSKYNKNTFRYKLKKDLKDNIGLYLLIIPGFAFLLLFSYVPLYGISLAFKDYDMSLGIMKSPSVGLYNFARFFKGYYFSDNLNDALTDTDIQICDENGNLITNYENLTSK